VPRLAGLDIAVIQPDFASAMAKLFQQLNYRFRCVGVITGAGRQTLIVDAMTRAEGVFKDLIHDVVLNEKAGTSRFPSGNRTFPCGWIKMSAESNDLANSGFYELRV
jgi:hypothetical protein